MNNVLICDLCVYGTRIISLNVLFGKKHTSPLLWSNIWSFSTNRQSAILQHLLKQYLYSDSKFITSLKSVEGISTITLFMFYICPCFILGYYECHQITRHYTRVSYWETQHFIATNVFFIRQEFLNSALKLPNKFYFLSCRDTQNAG